MSDPAAAPDGRVDFNPNERVTSDDLDNIGEMALRAVCHLLAWLVRDLVADAPPSGFPGDDCKPSLSSAPLTVGVAKGRGFYYDSAETSVWGTHYKPVVVAAAFTTVLAAHDATHPRIDIVCLAPAREEDQPQNRLVFANTTPQSLNKRSVCAYTLQVVSGTPAATPSVPSTPAGYLKIAECRVPAITGSATVTDTRPLLAFGQAWASDPAAPYIAAPGFVPGSSTELAVSASSPAAMTVEIAAGEAVIVGTKGTRRHRYIAATLAISASDPSNGRRDLVVAKEDGTLAVVTGTPSGSPVVPSTPSGAVPLARIQVDAAVTTITSGKITDLRQRWPFGSDQLRRESIDSYHLLAEAVGTPALAPASVTGVKLSVPPAIPVLTAGSPSGSLTPITIDTQDPDGEQVTRTVRYFAEMLDANFERIENDAGPPLRMIDVTTGTAISTDQKTALIFDTDASGNAAVNVQHSVGAPIYLRVTPLNTPGSPAIVGFTAP